MEKGKARARRRPAAFELGRDVREYRAYIGGIYTRLDADPVVAVARAAEPDDPSRRLGRLGRGMVGVEARSLRSSVSASRGR